jgi:tetratricopeptide (TPR) repeat protein
VPLRAPILALLALAVSSAAAGDTIVLKNGRRIQAESVTETGNRVTYETSAGQMSLPKAIVARIERDNYSAPSSSAASSGPPVSAPQVEPVRGYEDVARLAVHNDSVDYPYLAKLELDAESGAPAAIAKVAAAHHAAAQFLLGKGDTNAAVDQYRQALAFAPDNIGLLLNLAVLYLQENQFTAALDPLERARRIAPDSPDVAKLMGWAYYGSNKMDQAIEEWKRALRLRPDPDVQQALEKVERDKAEEAGYSEGETVHFALKYYGGAAPQLAQDILHALEDDFRDLESQLDYTPTEQIPVILYTNQAFGDITRAPSWVGALYDGQLRIPVQGLSQMTPELAHVLKHELTHCFVGQKTHNRAPTWLQEGIAQYMEGRRSTSSAGPLLDMAGKGQIPSLGSMESSWMGRPAGEVTFNYAWSLAAVESMIDAGGVGDISRLLDRIATSPNTESAMQETLHLSYDDLQQQTIDYLKRAYLN